MLEEEWNRLSREKEYFSEVISPFSYASVYKKIRKKIMGFASKGKTAIDLGTGLGKLLLFLSKNFKKVTAMDYSGEMIAFAREKNKNLPNVAFEKMDMRKIHYKNEFDVAVSINSVLSPSVIEVNKILKNIHALLKKNGKLVAVFPSLESVLYMAMLVYEKKRKSYGRKAAREKTAEIIESSEYDFLLGFLKEEGGRQKHFYEFEVEYRLKKAGFKNIKIEKLPYPWEILEDKDRYFPKEAPIWDWLVTASRTA